MLLDMFQNERRNPNILSCQYTFLKVKGN